jgi:hypothetical protein
MCRQHCSAAPRTKCGFDGPRGASCSWSRRLSVSRWSIPHVCNRVIVADGQHCRVRFHASEDWTMSMIGIGTQSAYIIVIISIGCGPPWLRVPMEARRRRLALANATKKATTDTVTTCPCSSAAGFAKVASMTPTSIAAQSRSRTPTTLLLSSTMILGGRAQDRQRLCAPALGLHDGGPGLCR